MAWQFGPYGIQFTLVDDDGAKSVHAMNLIRANTTPDVEAFAAAMVPLLHALVDCSVQRYNIILPAYNDAVALGAAGSDIERKAVFNFATDAGTVSSFALPGCKEAILATNKRDINLAHTDVLAYTAAMIGGLLSVDPVDYRGADIVSVLEAYKQNRKSHVQRGRRKG